MPISIIYDSNICHNKCLEKSLIDMKKKEIITGNTPKETYNITSLFVVAFFFGTITMVILGNKNLQRLAIPKKIIVRFTIAGIIIMVMKCIFLMYTIHFFTITSFFEIISKEFRFVSQFLTIILYLFYYQVMDKKYHEYLEEGVKPGHLFKGVLLWGPIGILSEALIFFITFQITFLLF